MPNYTITPNMGLLQPTVGADIGPDYANQQNASITTIDQHNHAPGNGVAITPTGLNINSDLPFNGNNATLLRSLNLSVQGSPLMLSTDIGCLYVSGVDLWYNDESGTQIQITKSGSVFASSSGISSGSATASFTAGVLVVNAASLTPANIQCASLLIGNNVASSNYLTLQPPNAMASSFSVTLPSVPAQTSVLTMDTSGNISASVNPNTLVPSGVISAFGGVSAPSGYLMCDGTSYLRSSYPALFAVIGTAYGAPDGTHFNVPDLRGLFQRGTDNGAGNDPNAASRIAQYAGGASGNNVGSYQPQETKLNSIGLTDPGHFHRIYGSAGNDGGAGFNGAFDLPPGTQPQGNRGGVPTEYFYDLAARSNTTGISLSSGSETRPSNVYVNYIIKT